MVRKKLSEVEQLARELEQWIKKLRCSGSTGLSIETFPDVKVGVDPSPVNRLSQSHEVYSTSEVTQAGGDTVQLTGTVRNNGKLHGTGEIRFQNGDTIRGEFEDGKRSGYCETILQESRHQVISIRGEYRNDMLEGKARIYFKNRSWLEGYFKYGIQHGFARLFDKKGRLQFIGNYQNGVPVGVCWRVIRGGGCVVGRVDRKGQLTGYRIAYIYPDFRTVLVGQFNNAVMQSAQQATIESIIDDDSGIKIPVFSRPSGHTHIRQIGTFDHICSDPLERDPYESRYIDTQVSAIQGAAEGIFAQQDVEPNTIVAFYNGSRANPTDFDPSTWETNNYRIFDPADMPNGTIDIPVWAQDRSRYCGSLAHKCNHSFLPNAEFVVFDHPKFGVIPCITSIADIYVGEEILVGYGYELADSPDWYQTAWKNSTYAAKGISYKDWLDCNVKRPLGLRDRAIEE